jgi:hypothetical protein
VVVNELEVNEFDWHFEIDVWSHIAVIYEGNSVKIYKDGLLTETGELTDLSITGKLYIGGVGKSLYNTLFWDGDMYEICIFNYPLSDSDIEDLYQNGVNLEWKLFYFDSHFIASFYLMTVILIVT